MNKPLDAALSREIALQIKSKEKDSFNKSYKAALLLEGSMYVQGFLVVDGKPYTPIEHSWVELDERLVDPTRLQQGDNVQERYYFPAQRLSVEELKAAVEEAKEDYPDDPPLPVYGEAPYEYYGDVMLGGKEYKDAHEQALVKCRELNKPKIKKETN
jgi:hypothetical protein